MPRAPASRRAARASRPPSWPARPSRSPTLDARVAERRAGVAQARAEDDWFAEFEAVCSRTQDAMTIPTDELRALVARCEQLKPRIAALDPSRKKVYAKRLQLCRDLFQFVLETRDPK